MSSLSRADPPPPVGYHRLSTYIASDPTLSVYRSFTALNTRNLLYLQSELASLEARLLRLDANANDMTQGNDVWSLPRCWDAIRKAGLNANIDALAGGQGHSNSGHLGGEMWKTIIEIRKILEAYSMSFVPPVGADFHLPRPSTSGSRLASFPQTTHIPGPKCPQRTRH